MKTILVVDDDSRMLKLLNMYLAPVYHANIVVNTFTILNYQKLHILKYMEYHCFITFSRR